MTSLGKKHVDLNQADYSCTPGRMFTKPQRSAIMPKIEGLSIAVNATEEWIDDLLRRLGWSDRERAYLVLLAALHALRDAVARDEAVYIGAQLPPLLRGLYYEGWHPGTRPAAHSRAAFLERIHDGGAPRPGRRCRTSRSGRICLARGAPACGGSRGRQSRHAKGATQPVAKLRSCLGRTTPLQRCYETAPLMIEHRRPAFGREIAPMVWQ